MKENYLKHLCVIIIGIGSIALAWKYPEYVNSIIQLWVMILTYIFVKNGYAVYDKKKNGDK